MPRYPVTDTLVVLTIALLLGELWRSGVPRAFARAARSIGRLTRLAVCRVGLGARFIASGARRVGTRWRTTGLAAPRRPHAGASVVVLLADPGHRRARTELVRFGLAGLAAAYRGLPPPALAILVEAVVCDEDGAPFLATLRHDSGGAVVHLAHLVDGEVVPADRVLVALGRLYPRIVAPAGAHFVGVTTADGPLVIRAGTASRPARPRSATGVRRTPSGTLTPKP
ncbi:MAG TPA: hypothetical protein VFW96_21525 [Thermomicrobiales bacterium]|nr:hypothetical protein [Thermomicrobiales bacterium]